MLEGSVRKSGDRIRITAQLVRASDSSRLSSETYDRTLNDVFGVQDEISAAVVAQLRMKLLGAVPTAPEGRRRGPIPCSSRRDSYIAKARPRAMSNPLRFTRRR